LVPELIVTKGPSNQVIRVSSFPFDVKYRSEFEAYTAELSQIFQGKGQTFVVGGRIQDGRFDTRNELNVPLQGMLANYTNTFPSPAALMNQLDDFQRATAYAYYTLEPLKDLFATAGLSYDIVKYPI